MINFLDSVAFCTHKSTPFSVIGYDVEDSNEELFSSVANQVVELNGQRGCRYSLCKESLTFEFNYKHHSALGVESSMSIDFRFKIRNNERLEHLYNCLPIFCKIMRETAIQNYVIKPTFSETDAHETTIHDEKNGLYYGPLPQGALSFENTIKNLPCFMFDLSTIKMNDESTIFSDMKAV